MGRHRQRVIIPLREPQDLIHRVMPFEGEGVECPLKHFLNGFRRRELALMGNPVEKNADLRLTAAVNVDMMAVVDMALVQMMMALARFIFILDDEEHLGVLMGSDPDQQFFDGRVLVEDHQLRLALSGAMYIDFKFFHDF